MSKSNHREALARYKATLDTVINKRGPGPLQVGGVGRPISRMAERRRLREYRIIATFHREPQAVSWRGPFILVGAHCIVVLEGETLPLTDDRCLRMIAQWMAMRAPVQWHPNRHSVEWELLEYDRLARLIMDNSCCLTGALIQSCFTMWRLLCHIRRRVRSSLAFAPLGRDVASRVTAFVGASDAIYIPSGYAQRLFEGASRVCPEALTFRGISDNRHSSSLSP